MESKLSNDFYNLTAKLMMAQERREIMNIVGDFLSTIDKLAEAEKNGSGNGLKTKVKAESYFLKFTQKEISRMATTFKKEFIANGLATHVIKRESGKNSYCYEIRYRSNGYNITASSTDLAEAKRKFLEKTTPSEIEKYRIGKDSKNSDLFADIFEKFFKYKAKSKITIKTLSGYRVHFNRIPNSIKEKRISLITTLELTEYMERLEARAYEDMRTVFNGVFKFAMSLGLIQSNPVALVPFERADRKIREGLSEEEIENFLRRIPEPQFDKIRQMAYFYYFFGLRASELDEETRREGDFLITRNRKRKKGKIEYKKIPIPIQAENLIDWNMPLHRTVRAVTANKLFKELLGNEKTAYNLRHTFSSICQQYVRQEIVEIWIGDSPIRLIAKHYTHFSDKFMREQMNMVIFPTLEMLT